METVAHTSQSGGEVLLSNAPPPAAATLPPAPADQTPLPHGGMAEPPPRREYGQTPPLHEGRFWAEAIAVAAGGLCSLLGALVIAGWLLGIPALTRLRPALTPMMFNAALGFLVCGLALATAARRCHGWRWTVRMAGFLISLLGLLTLVEYLFAVNLLIDTALFSGPYPAQVFPGRMSPNAALALTLSGAGLLLSSLGSRPKAYAMPLGLLGSGVAALGLVSLLGYIAGVSTAYRWGGYKEMAAHGAAGFLVLGAGLSALAWKNGAGHEAPRWLPISAGIGLCSATLLLWEALRIKEAQHGVFTALPTLTLTLGLLMSLLSVATVHLAQRARQRARQFEVINAILETEIHRRKQVEQSRELLSEVLEASTDYVSTSDIRGNITYINPAGRAMLGLGADQPVSGLQLADVHPRWATELIQRQGIPAAVERGSWQGETALLNRQGTEIPLSQVIVCHRSAEGKPAFLSTIMRDISERKRAQEELRKSASYTRSLIEASLDPLVTISKEGRILDVNRATEVVTGRGREQLIGSDFSDYFTEPENARRGYQQVFAQGFVQDYPLAIRHIAGRVTDVLYNAVLFRGDSGAVEGVFAAARDITERKRAEAELRRTAEQLALATEAAGVGTWHWDLTRDQLTFSPQCKALFDFPADEPVTYSRFLQGVHPEDRGRTELAIKRALETRTDYSADYRAVWRDESVHWIVALGRATYDPQDHLLYMTGVTLEITNRKRLEQELMERQAYTRSLIESCIDALATVSPEGIITDVNHHMETLTGVAREQLIGTAFKRYFTDPQRAEEGVRLVLRQGTVTNYELVARSEGGHETVVAYNANTFHNAKGELQGVFAAARDITERKRAEEELRASQQRLALHIQQTPLGVIEWNLNYEVAQWNPRAEALFGYTREEALGRHSNFIVPDAFRPQTHQVWAELLARKGGFRSSNENLTKDGRYIVCEWYNTPLVDARGEVIGVASLVEDITERKKAEEALERYAKELERSNTDLADFASIASHDLQEPLRKVMAFGERLNEHCAAQLDEQGKDFLQRMCSAAQRMSDLIEALLQYSRLNTRAQPFAPVDMGAVTKEVLADLEARIAESNATLEIGPMPRLHGDAIQLRQLLQNLLGNALKFHPPDRVPHVTMSSRRTAGGWEIEVTDDGVGFDEKYLDRIFRPFQRLHGRGEFAGSGMGLAICRKIVSRHGGTITARSAPEQGARFIVFLPEKAEEGRTE